jgi:alcohol dehydrogenase
MRNLGRSKAVAPDMAIENQATMRAVRVPAGAQHTLCLDEGGVPDPGPGTVRIRVRACGICHSDMLTVQNVWPGIAYPRAPGHEIAGTIDAIGWEAE